MYNNTKELRDFVFECELMDNHSNIAFDAIVEINTERRDKEIKARVLITFDGYNNAGTLQLLTSDLDPHIFPTLFKADYQEFRFKDHEYLEIKGTHIHNPAIGKYTVTVRPLS